MRSSKRNHCSHSRFCLRRHNPLLKEVHGHPLRVGKQGACLSPSGFLLGGQLCLFLDSPRSLPSQRGHPLHGKPYAYALKLYGVDTKRQCLLLSYIILIFQGAQNRILADSKWLMFSRMLPVDFLTLRNTCISKTKASCFYSTT